MTVAEALARSRQILNEVTAGFYVDATDITDALDSGEKQVVQVLIAKQRYMQLQGQDYACKSLEPLITLDTANTTTTGTGYQEYTLPADFIDFVHAEYSTTNGGTKYPCAYMDFAKSAKKNSLGYISIKTTTAYVRAEKLGFFPQPTGAGAGNYAHYYYAQPAAISTNFTLREETHEAIIFFALADLLFKDYRSDSNNYYQKAVELISKL